MADKNFKAHFLSIFNYYFITYTYNYIIVSSRVMITSHYIMHRIFHTTDSILVLLFTLIFDEKSILDRTILK